MDILTILITAASVSILWIVYLKFFKKERSSQDLEELKNKEHEIDLIKLQHEKDLSLLKQGQIILVRLQVSVFLELKKHMSR